MSRIVINGVPPFCQAVDCDKPTSAMVSTLKYGWVAFCTDHGVLQLAIQGAITEEPKIS